MSSNLDRYFERSAQLGEEIQSLQRRRGPPESAEERQTWQPCFEIYRLQDHLFIDVELPGVPAEALTVETRPDMVTLRGEKPNIAHLREREQVVSSREYGPFTSQFAVPPGYRLDDLEQRLDHGVLHLKIRIVPRQAIPDGQ